MFQALRAPGEGLRGHPPPHVRDEGDRGAPPPPLGARPGDGPRADRARPRGVQAEALRFLQDEGDLSGTSSRYRQTEGL